MLLPSLQRRKQHLQRSLLHLQKKRKLLQQRKIPRMRNKKSVLRKITGAFLRSGFCMFLREK